MLSNGSLGPGRPRNSPSPARISVITLIALVYRNNTAERTAIRPGRAPRSTMSHPPTARLPTPPSDTAAPRPAYTPQRHRRPERLLAQRHARTDSQGRAIEYLEERHHIARAGER